MREALIENYRQWRGSSWRGRPAEMARALEHFEKWCSARGLTSFANVDSATAGAYARDLASERNAKGEPRSWADQSRRVGYISSAFKAARKRGLLASNPWSGVGVAIAKTDAREAPETYSVEEIRRLYFAAKAIRWGNRRHEASLMLFRVLAHSMLRPSECFGLTKADVALVDGVVVLTVRDGKSPAACRTVPMPNGMEDFYTWAQSRDADEIFDCFPARHVAGRTAWLSANWTRLAKAAAVEGTPYGLRRTGITQLAQSETHPRVQDYLSGHSSSSDIKVRHYISGYGLPVLVRAMEHVKPFG